MESFEDYLNEAIRISDYKKWAGDYDMNNVLQQKLKKYFMHFKDHDKNYYRIYVDLPINKDNWEVKIPKEISDYFGWFGIKIVDYMAGICRDPKDGREVRIGKLLNARGEDKLLKTYNDSKTNVLKDVDDLQIVISRHPYDLLGKSTDRGWTTCMDLYDSRYGGKHNYHLKMDLKQGDITSYLIRKKDRNINNPLSRISLVQNGVYSLFGQLHFKSKNPPPGQYRVDKLYGTYVPEYEAVLRKIVDDPTRGLNAFLKKPLK